MDSIEKSIRIGVVDANLTARSYSRKVFIQFSLNWPDRSNSLFSTLDPSAQKTIESELSGNNIIGSISSSSISSSLKTPLTKKIITNSTPTSSITNKPRSNVLTTSTSSSFLPQRNVDLSTPKPTPSHVSSSISSISGGQPTFQIGKPLISNRPSIKKISTPPLISKNFTSSIITPPHHNFSINSSISSSSSNRSSSNDSYEKKRLFSSVTDSLPSRKKQMISHPSSPDSIRQQHTSILEQPFKTISTSSSSSSLIKQPLKISKSITNNTISSGNPIKNYVRDIHNQQSKLLANQK